MATAFWIADRKQYIEEAAASAESLQRHNPDVARELWTPNPQITRNLAFDRIRQLPPRRWPDYWFVDAVWYVNLAVGGIQDERQLYLDTDTYVCGDISAIFDMLDKFDFVGAYAPGRRTANGADDVPKAFPEINVGVNGIRRTPQIRHALYSWHKLIEAEPQNNDQPALRKVLWEKAGTLRVGILPPEYNCRWGFGGFARYGVKVLHGRPMHPMTYEGIARRLNARKEMRGWERGKLL